MCGRIIFICVNVLWLLCTLPYLPWPADYREFSGTIRNEPSAAHCSTVDVVYTWVNGSDTNHNNNDEHVAREPMLYRDYGTLRYSMRSVMTYAPWIRHIILITNGQVPHWLNISHPRIRLVTHEQYYGNREWLPTYNSNAIESQFYRLKDTSSCFFYLNDDVLFANHIRLSDYIDDDTGVQTIDQWDLIAPHASATYGGGSSASASSVNAAVGAWHQTIADNNEIIEEYYHVGNPTYRDTRNDDHSWLTKKHVHHYAGHECHFFQKRVLDTIVHHWPVLVNDTASHTRRRHSDMTLPFIYAQVALHEFDAKRASRDGYYMQFTDDIQHNQRGFDFIRKKRPNCICINDRLGHQYDNAQIRAVLVAMNEFMTSLFPYAAPFELPSSFDMNLNAITRGTSIPPVASPPSSWPTMIYVPFTYTLIAQIGVLPMRLLLFAGWTILASLAYLRATMTDDSTARYNQRKRA